MKRILVGNGPGIGRASHFDRSEAEDRHDAGCGAGRPSRWIYVVLAFAPLFAGACGSASAPAPTLANCARGTTVADFETNFIAPTCGKGNGSCHSAGLFSPNLSDLPLYSKLLDQTPTRFCLTNKLIDSKKPSDSFVLSKVHESPPHCPGTTTAAGDPMPWHMPSLSDADKACMDGYVQMVATGK